MLSRTRNTTDVFIPSDCELNNIEQTCQVVNETNKSQFSSVTFGINTSHLIIHNAVHFFLFQVFNENGGL